MAKRKRSVSLSFVLLRFAIVMICCMLLCCSIWYAAIVQLQKNGILYQGAVSNQQVERMMAGNSKSFVIPDEDFLAEYALFNSNGEVVKTNVEGKPLESLTGFFREDSHDMHVARKTYSDGSTVIVRWHFRTEFADPALRDMLPPAEYLGLAALGAALLLCLVFNTLWLRRSLAAKLKLFKEVSEKVGAQELDFTVPHAGIKEYDRALDAMENMRRALYDSLSKQWAVRQEREAEIAALAHDLKTPLTLAGGNAELLLEEELPGSSRKMLETIVTNNKRARQYVESLLETSSGVEETFENISLSDLFDETYRSSTDIAKANGVCLKFQNSLKGVAKVQKNHWFRALGNIVLNAIEHTPSGGTVHLEGSMTEEGWQITVRDEGPGFSKAALHHATERLWRDDAARSADGHHGLGLWFAAEVVKAHKAELILSNCDSGGMVTIKSFCTKGRKST